MLSRFGLVWVGSDFTGFGSAVTLEVKSNRSEPIILTSTWSDLGHDSVS